MQSLRQVLETSITLHVRPFGFTAVHRLQLIGYILQPIRHAGASFHRLFLSSCLPIASRVYTAIRNFVYKRLERGCDDVHVSILFPEGRAGRSAASSAGLHCIPPSESTELWY